MTGPLDGSHLLKVDFARALPTVALTSGPDIGASCWQLSEEQGSGPPRWSQEERIRSRIDAADPRDDAASQILCNALVAPGPSGMPDAFVNLGSAMSWINSLRASISNGLRSIFRFEGAAFAASL